MPSTNFFDVLVIGGGHAGAEAAWAAANMLRPRGGRVAMVTMDPTKIGAMSCNPAIGGLAKGQMVREIDALGGLMGLAADATGIQFRVLNASKGPAVRGPRCQSDKYLYAKEVQRLLGTRENLIVLAGTVDDLLVEGGRVTGVIYSPSPAACRPWREMADGEQLGDDCCSGEFFTGPNGETPEVAPTRLNAKAVVLTTGTFMRGLMHTGERKSEGGRVGEGSAVGISGTLRKLGFELGRLKTGTPPRLAAETIDFDGLQLQPGDEDPTAFSEMTGVTHTHLSGDAVGAYEKVRDRFPVVEQRPCWITHTNAAAHELIRANLDRAPMYNGQIETAGPRYCPSIEDKVVRFADRGSHHVFLEPESLSTNEIYCNGISTSLPADVQDRIVAQLPGCERARILRYGYAVEYDMVRPHQIDATCMTKSIAGLFLAGQINGTSGYEEAAGQGLVAGVNAVRSLRGEDLWRLRRDEAYIGVLLDDLVTKTPREPYRMFTSRAEYRLMLRADNADTRLTATGRELGLVDDARWAAYEQRSAALAALRSYLDAHKENGTPLSKRVLQEDADAGWVLGRLNGDGSLPASARDVGLIHKLLAEIKYAGFLHRQQKEVSRLAEQEQTQVPGDFSYEAIEGMRTEAKKTLSHFRPATLGQAGRLAGVTPADVMVLAIAMRR